MNDEIDQKSDHHDPYADWVPSGLLRRLGAILYDTMLLVGVIIVAAVLAEGFATTVGDGIDREHPLFLLYQIYLAVVIFLFFGYFWVRGGQTLGMRAWRLRVLRDDGASLRWSDALRRFLFSLLSWIPCGLGFLWILVSPQQLAWHDRWSATRVWLIPRDTGTPKES